MVGWGSEGLFPGSWYSALGGGGGGCWWMAGRFDAAPAKAVVQVWVFKLVVGLG